MLTGMFLEFFFDNLGTVWSEKSKRVLNDEVMMKDDMIVCVF